MTYVEKMSSANPGLIILMIDQSLSMDEPYGNNGEKKKDIAALAVNRVICEIVEANCDAESIRDKCFIAVIGYGTKNPGVDLILGNMISEVAENPIRVEQVKRKISDGAGGLVEIVEDFPVWVEPIAEGETPMGYAFQRASQLAEDWCNSHTYSFPPVVINIVGSKPENEMSIKVEAEKLRSIKNDDGSVLLFNAFFADGLRKSIILPGDKNLFNDCIAEFLFDISSELPEKLLSMANLLDQEVSLGARGMLYNGDVIELIELLTFGKK